MFMLTYHRRTRGFTLAETIVAVTLMVLVGTMVGVSSSFLGFSVLEGRLQSEVRNDTVLGLQTIMRDCYVATNVSPSAGPFASTDHQVVLRVPMRDETGETVTDRFEFVVYSIVPAGEDPELEGLVREVYRAPENVQKSDPEAIPGAGDLVEKKTIKRNLTYMRVDYGGVSISQVLNLSVVGDLGVYISGEARAMNQDPYIAATYIEIALRNRKAIGWRMRTPPVQ